MQRAESTDIVLVASTGNAQFGRLSSDENKIGGCLGFELVQTDNYSCVLTASWRFSLFENPAITKCQLYKRLQNPNAFYIIQL